MKKDESDQTGHLSFGTKHNHAWVFHLSFIICVEPFISAITVGFGDLSAVNFYPSGRGCKFVWSSKYYSFLEGVHTLLSLFCPSSLDLCFCLRNMSILKSLSTRRPRFYLSIFRQRAPTELPPSRVTNLKGKLLEWAGHKESGSNPTTLVEQIIVGETIAQSHPQPVFIEGCSTWQVEMQHHDKLIMWSFFPSRPFDKATGFILYLRVAT